MRISGLRMICLGLVIAVWGGYAGAQQGVNRDQATPAQPPGSTARGAGDQAGSRTQPASASASDPQTGKTAEEEAKEKEIERQEHSQRALGLYPQFAVTSRGNAPPLTPGAKFHLFFKSAFDPFAFGLAGLQAGVDQAEDEFPTYGQGAKGYGKRYASDFGDGVSSGFWTDFFWPVVTKEDPRYFRMGQGRFIHRLGYGLAQSVVCHTDSGGRSFNFSNFLGAFSAGALSNTYHPQDDRGVGLTARGASFALAYGSLGQLLNEFWPDVSARIHKHHKKKEDLNQIPPDPPR